MSLQSICHVLLVLASFTFFNGCGGGSTGTTGAPPASELDQYLAENPEALEESMVELDEE